MRLPLSAKIALWFGLNVVALAAVFALLFNAQFNLDLDWLLATGARERLEAVRNLIVGELNTTAPDDWPQVLARYSAAHDVEFALFDDTANSLVGGIAALPEEVRARILARGPGRERSARPVEAASDPAPFPPRNFSRARRFWAGPPIRAIMRTSDPTRYWLLTSARLDNPQTGDPMRVVLVARSSTLSAGGLIFDPWPWLALGLGAVVFSLRFWLPLVRGMSRAFARMTHATQQIANGRFDVRVNARRRDELGSLSTAIDQMAERLDGFVKGQKRFLGDIAHELCAPLAKLQMALGILEQRASDGEKPYVKSASEKAGQIATLVGELLSFSKASFGAAAVHVQPINVREAADEAIRRESADGAKLRLAIPDELSVAADRDLLVRALANLLRNAMRHAGPDADISITAAREDGDVIITFEDDGPGVPEQELPRIFDAFYRVDTTRPRDTGGTGLGLTIVKACIESCSGSVVARNCEPQGLQVLVRLRVAEPIEAA